MRSKATEAKFVKKFTMVDNKINMINKDEIEVEAKTAQEAIKLALSKLNVKKSKVEISILREENKGLFSMQGTKLAKVRIKKIR